MIDLRDKLRKAAGLFVELPPSENTPHGDDQELLRMVGVHSERQIEPPSAKTVEQIVAASEGPNLDEIHASVSSMPPSNLQNGNVDFQAIYKNSGLPIAPFTAEQTLDMLASMPPDFPLETKRQSVRVTLGAMGKAIGATSESIVADASRKLTAITAYAEKMAKHTADLTNAEESEIAAMQTQMQEKRNAIELAKRSQEQLMQACHAETDRLDDVLEFFSLDVPASNLSPPNTK